MRRVLLVSVLLVLAACSTNFREDHYFKSVGNTGDKPTNYFRLRITGEADFSSARYIAGYYDERAVDLFFDEMKSASSSNDAKIDPLFQGGEIDLGEGEKIAPLSPTLENGAFLMIFSTNAKAVANTIGQFAESQVAADAITNLVNRDQVKEAARAKASNQMAHQRAQAVAAEIESLVNAIPAPSQEDEAGNDETEDDETADEAGVTEVAKEATTQAALRLLAAIAQAKGRVGSFQSIEEARAWFQAEQAKEAAQ